MEENTKVAKKQFSRVGGYFMLGTVVIYVVQLIPIFAIKMLKPEWLQNGDIALILSITPMYVLGMPFLIWLLGRLPADKPMPRRISPGKFAVAFMMCYSLMYISNIAGTLITTVLGFLKGSAVNNAIMDIATSSNMLLTFLYMVICAPIFEEYIFRKLIIDRTVRYGQGVSILISGLMFGLFHGNLNQFVYAFSLGCFFAFLYVKTGNLKITILMHMIVNFMGGILGVLVLKLLNYEDLMIAASSGDFTKIMQSVQNNFAGWMLYIFYVTIVLGIAITGFILLIVFRKRFKLQENPETAIQKGKRFQTAVLNPGMLVYCGFWIIMIVTQLFM